MASRPATIDGDTYKYIKSVIDIFSRLPPSLPLETKEAKWKNSVLLFTCVMLKVWTIALLLMISI